MKKKLIAWLLVICMAISLLPAAALADTAATSGKCGDNVTWTLSDDGTLTISGKGAMYDSTDAGTFRPDWESCSRLIKSVIITDGVTNICENAFEAAYNLESISIPDSVLTIGIAAFNGCNKLESIRLPKNLKTIDQDTFFTCTGLKSVELNGKLEKISTNAFYFCTSLESINLPNSLKIIDCSAFRDCKSLKNIVLPDNLKIIGENAFDGTNLTFKSIPSKLELIGYDAFNTCSIERVDIPASLKVIKGNPFGTNVGAYYVDENNPVYAMQDGLLWNVETGTIIGCGINQCREAYVLGFVYEIANNAFANCSNLKEIMFMGNRPKFGSSSFYKTTVTIYYPNGDKTWNDYGVGWNFGGKITWVPYDVPATKTPQISLTTGSSTGKPLLKWADDENAVAFAVYRSTSKAGDFTLLDTPDDAKYLDTSAVPGRTYYYIVTAVDMGGNEKQSAIKSITCDCARPVVSISTNASSGKPSLKWNAVDGASKYEVYRATSKNGTYTKMYTTTSTSYTNSSAVAGTTYYYKVKAICGKSSYGNSAYSVVKSITCDCARPTVTVKCNENTGKPVLSWKAVDGASKYYIYRSTDGGKTYKYWDSTSKTSYTNSGAEAGKTYYYKVKAVCGKSSYGNSAQSLAKSIVCDCAKPVLSITAVNGKPKLSWNAVDGATKYWVYRSTDGKNFKYYDTTTKLSYTNMSTTAGTTYYYKLKAVNGSTSYDASALSNAVSLKVK